MIQKIAVYARVSTKHQELETQLLPLRAYIQSRGLVIAGTYLDFGVSGSKESRPELDRLMKDARKRKFDGVLVARFDRFARSVRHLVTALGEFNSLGIQFISLNESIDTSTPMGKAMFAVIGAMAELERDLIRERIHAGLNRARSQGKKLGPPLKIFDRGRAIELRKAGKSFRVIAREFGVSKDTIVNVVRAGGL